MKFWLFLFLQIWALVFFLNSANAKSLTIGIYDLPPHMILSSQQSPRGAVVDFLKEQIFTGTNFEREKTFLYSQYPLFTTNSGLVVNKDFKLKQIKELEELRGLKLGHDLGSVVPTSLKNKAIRFEFVSGEEYFPRNLSLLRAARTQGFFVPIKSL